jgi:hypothetical protein
MVIDYQAISTYEFPLKITANINATQLPQAAQDGKNGHKPRRMATHRSNIASSATAE